MKIEYCTPDHDWPTSTPFWYEASIQCLSCSKLYEIQQRGNNFVLVKRKNIAESEELASQARSLTTSLMETAKVAVLLDTLITLLEQQPSIAATHRLLSGAGLEHLSLATFRKRWNGAHTWVKSHTSTASLSAIMSIIGSKDTEIEHALAQIKEISNAASIPVSIVGEPFYTRGYRSGRAQ